MKLFEGFKKLKTGSEGPDKDNPIFLDVIAEEMRFRNFDELTIKSYMHCYRALVRHFHPRHPRLLGEQDIKAYLDGLSDDVKRPQARLFEASNALKFLYAELYQKRFSLAWPVEPPETGSTS